MGRGGREDRPQGAQELLFGPRRSLRQAERESDWLRRKDLRLSYSRLLRQDPEAFFDQLETEVLVEVGPLEQSSGQTKSWQLVREDFGSGWGFNIKTILSDRSGKREGSDGKVWYLDEAIEKMAESCDRDKRVSLDQKLSIDHLNRNDIYDHLVESAVDQELKRSGVDNKHG